MNQDRLQATAARTVFIGVDGGASGFRAHEIEVGGTLALGAHSAAERTPPVAGFAPLPFERQREEASRGSLERSREERELAARWIETAARAVSRVAALSGKRAATVGVCAPGLKSADGRGIVVALHGPRIPDFAAALEQRLAELGLALAQPIGRIASDGEACGQGEELAAGGRFRGALHAWYVGGGSGVAEAYKLEGRVRSADELAALLPKAWQLRAEDGRDFEASLSVAGLNREFAASGAPDAESDALPERAAAAGDPRARALLERCGERLAGFACARLAALHRARGLVLERAVVGQRLGLFFLDPRLEACFAEPARRALAARLARSAPDAVRAAWLSADGLAPDRLVGSDLRAAPALGALALALGRA